MRPIIKPVEEDQASERVSAAYEDVKERYDGFLPPMYKYMANDPEYLESINEHMKRVLEPRKVDAKTKEVIAYTVAALNQCDYCINAHSKKLKMVFDFDDEGLAELLSTIALWDEVNRFNIGSRITSEVMKVRPGGS